MRVVIGAIAIALAAAAAPAEVTIERHDDRYTVKIDGQLFTQYIFKGYDKPILYPVIGPHGIPMTRNYPMKEGVEGEAKDHPHHKSLWFSHGNVNGVDFWGEGEKMGKVLHKEAWQLPVRSDAGVINANAQWRTADGVVVLEEERAIVVTASTNARIIDLIVNLFARDDAVIFGDTKEGTMAIRTRPELEIRNGAKAVNSEGVTGKEIWGKRAKWVDYSAVVDGKTVGVAIFDHPSNPRHPTWWHARDYGLIAANPFGIHDFEKGQPEGAGDMKIPAGKSVTFRYRFVFHEGDAEQAGIAKMYEEYAGEPTRDPGDQGRAERP